MPRKKKKKKSNIAKYALICLNILLLCAIFFIIGLKMQTNPAQRPDQGKTEPAVRQITELKPTPAAPTATPVSLRETPQGAISGHIEKPHPQKGRIAVVIDDAGYDLDMLRKFVSLPLEITIAVLPDLPHSSEAARLAHENGKEVLLHQPMESLNGNNPGPGAILSGQTDLQIREILKKNFESVPYATGMNNHMGSLITRDEAKMRVIIEFLRANDKYFLDSKTIENSVARNAAIAYNWTYLERDVFLDDDPDAAMIRKQLEKGMGIALQKGSAILIGHVQNREVLEVLKESIPLFREKGLELTRLSNFIKEKPPHLLVGAGY
jgi:uncharacterized protein